MNRFKVELTKFTNLFQLCYCGRLKIFSLICNNALHILKKCRCHNPKYFLVYTLSRKIYIILYIILWYIYRHNYMCRNKKLFCILFYISHMQTASVAKLLSRKCIERNFVRHGALTGSFNLICETPIGGITFRSNDEAKLLVPQFGYCFVICCS